MAGSFFRKKQITDRLQSLPKQLQRLTALFTPEFWKNWFRRPTDEVTLVLLTKGHLDVRKLRLSPKRLWLIKIGLVYGVAMLIISFIFLIDVIVRFPERSLLTSENRALRSELNKLQYNLDTLQMSVDRIARFDQKLRAITEVDKEFAKIKGPTGQGGGEEIEDMQNQTFDFGEYKVDGGQLEVEEESKRYLDRKDQFMIQKMYSWMRRLFKDSELQDQSMEELFEVLKGREIELASKPSILPVQGWPTSHFGYRLDPFTGRRALHRGIDIAAREGAPVVAPAGGLVTFSGTYGSYGNCVMIFHGYGISTLYAHLESLFVKPGQKIKRGDVVAAVGSTGRSTGAHVHYEVIFHGVPVDPRKYILDRTL